MSYSRRDFFSKFGRSFFSNVIDSVAVLRTGEPIAEPDHQETPQTWLRPPGALDEVAFREVCTQCTDCAEACPYKSIRRLGPEFGLDAGTPAIIPNESPCYLCKDMPCIIACEPRALRWVEPAAVAMGTAVVSPNACYLSSGQPCDYCVTRCPLKSDAISITHGGLPVVNQDGCVGCGVCAYLCPPGAITIARPTERSDSEQ
jgi:ferredoxin-type protein NapG